MVCVRSMEETLERRPTWAVIAPESKVHLLISGRVWQCSDRRRAHFTGSLGV